jgi:hypothetical protein
VRIICHLVKRAFFGFALLSPCLLLSCKPANYSFRTIQLCLKDEKDLLRFKKTMSIIALDNGMKYLDNSNRTRAELDAVRYVAPGTTKSDPIINIDLSDNLGMGVGASNLGLSGYQIVLGFSEGSSTIKAQRFSDSVVEKLAKQWRIEIVPAGRGALQMTSCGANSRLRTHK